MKPKQSIGVRPLSTVLKTLDVLNHLANSSKPLHLMELLKKTGGNRATLYQRLYTLVEAGWVEIDEMGRYRLSMLICHFSDVALEQAGLGVRVEQLLEDLMLKTQETISLAARKSAQIHIVKRVDAPQILRADVSGKQLLSFNLSASGRVITAFASEATINFLMKQKVSLANDKLLDEARTNGYAISSGEEIKGVRAIAVPILNRRNECKLALSLLAPISRFNVERFLPHMKSAARKIEATLMG